MYVGIGHFTFQKFQQMTVIVRFKTRHACLLCPCTYPLYTVKRNDDKVYALDGLKIIRQIINYANNLIYLL